jgi:predicted MFS family arabinose efflux permease
VFGPGMAGLSVALVGARWSLMVPAMFSAVAALALAWVHVPRTREAFSNSLLYDSWAGIAYVFRNRVLRMLAGTMTVYNMGTGALAVAIPVVVLERLHGGSKSVGVFFAVMGFAGFLAGIVMGRVGTERRERAVLAAGCALSGLGLIGLAYAHGALGAALEVAVCGVANGPLVVAMVSLRQRATEPQWFGRAFAVSMNVNFSGYPIGSALAGAILGHSITLALVVAAGLCFAGGIWPALLPAAYYEPVSTERMRAIATE